MSFANWLHILTTSLTQVHSIVSKMMIDEVLCGSWDQPTSTIVMHETQPTRLQDLCAQFTEKAGVLVDLNERALQLRTGGQREADEEGGRFGEGGSFQGSRRCSKSCIVPLLTRLCLMQCYMLRTNWGSG